MIPDGYCPLVGCIGNCFNSFCCLPLKPHPLMFLCIIVVCKVMSMFIFLNVNKTTVCKSLSKSAP